MIEAQRGEPTYSSQGRSMLEGGHRVPEGEGNDQTRDKVKGPALRLRGVNGHRREQIDKRKYL